MDYEIELDTLNTKKTDLTSLKQNGEDVYNEFNSSYLNQLSNTEIVSLKAKIKAPIERLKKGLANSNTWYTDYLTELSELEESLASFSAGTLTAPTEFTGEFIDMFGKVTMPTLQTGGDPHANAVASSGELSDSEREELVNLAKSQLGLPYNSMHYGPKEGDGQGFGCAMFVSYCYNNLLFDGASGQSRGNGFYGSTYEFWGNVTHDNYDAYNKSFVEVSPSEAKAGDVICFLNNAYSSDYYADVKNCYHVALYEGNNHFIESGGSGVSESDIDINRSDIRFLRYVGNT